MSLGGRVVGENELATIVEVHRPLFYFARLTFKRQQRRHVVTRKVRLQVRGLVCNDRVARRVTLIEAVSRELEDEIEELIRGHIRKAAFCGAKDEGCTRPIDDILLLLRNRLDDCVSFSQRNATEVMQDLHHLLLIDHDSVGLARIARDHFVHHRHRFARVLSRDECWDQLHRTWAKKRVRRDEIFQPIRLHLRHESLHTAGFKLKNAVRIATTEKRKDARIVERDAIKVEWMRNGLDHTRRIRSRFACCRNFHSHSFPNLRIRKRRVDDLFAALNRRERAKSEEVHLEQTDLLAGWAIPLRDSIFAAASWPTQRDNLIERTRCDDDAGCVNTLASRVIFETACMLDHACEPWIIPHRCRELRVLFECFVNRDIEFSGNKIREPLRFLRRKSHDTRNILDRRLRLQSTEGDDLRDMSIFLAHVLDDRRATILTNIDVDVGVLVAIGIRESLEEKPIRFGTRVGKPEHKSNHRSDT